MIESLLCMIAGGIIGVIIDRGWKRYESQTRISLKVSHFMKVGGEYGVGYRLHNHGCMEFPNHTILLFHPNLGTLGLFKCNGTGPLLPDQVRVHEATLIRNNVPDQYVGRWFARLYPETNKNLIFDGFVLRVVMQDSDKILYEDGVMGYAIAKDVYRTTVLGLWGEGGWDESQKMNSKPARTIKAWLKRRKERRLQMNLCKNVTIDNQVLGSSKR